jgi:transposase-like protein
MRALTLTDMRAEGIHSVSIDCPCCPSPDIVNVDHLRGGMGVPDVRYHVRCPSCGRKPLRSMPNWSERENVVGKPDTRAKG